MASSGNHDRRARQLFILICLVVTLATAGYVWWSSRRGPARSAGGLGAPTYQVGDRVREADAVAAVRSQPHIILRHLGPGPHYGRLAFASLADPDGTRVNTSFPCARVYAAADRLLCLAVEDDPMRPLRAYLLDDRLAVHLTFGSAGLPSRARVAPDGRLAAYTVFVSRDSYLAEGFSTRTRLVRTDTAGPQADLETFAVTRDGAPFSAPDFNYWGVTFRRAGSRFFATLGTQGHTYLVEGDAAARSVTVIRDGVECPSLSPDETRLAFKKKVEGGHWRPAILDLASGRETVLPEERSVDDQIAWLDDSYVLYAISHGSGAARTADVWSLPANGSAQPRRFASHAESPVVLASSLASP